jgi:serine/threonine protein kinase
MAAAKQPQHVDLLAIETEISVFGTLGETTELSVLTAAVSRMCKRAEVLKGVLATRLDRANEQRITAKLKEVDAVVKKLVHLVSVKLRAETGGEAPETRDELTLSQVEYSQRGLLGEGTFACVYKAKCRQTPVALKLLKNQTVGEAEAMLFRQEIKLYREISHCPNIVQLRGACTQPGSLFILTELLPSNLKKWISSNRSAPVHKRLIMARDIATGLNWLHQSKVCHRDLKPENLLVDEHETVKICDFGFSQAIEGSGRDDSTPKGSPLYMAPEVMALMDFDYSSDVYSFAIILWEMLTGQEPYPDAEDYQSLYNMVVIEGVRPPLNESAAIPEEIKPLLEKCWHADLTLRPNFDKIIRALENVIIPIVISPLPGSTSVPFWTSAFGHPLQLKVRADDLFSQLFGHAKYTPETWKTLGDQEGFVSMEEFGRMCKWFGQFFPPHEHAAELTAEVEKLLATPYYYHDISTSAMAVLRLNNCPPGTFLVRPSAATPNAEPFSISFVTPAKTISHTRVSRITYETSSKERFSVVYGNSHLKAPTVVDLVNQLVGQGAISLPCVKKAFKPTSYTDIPTAPPQ